MSQGLTFIGFTQIGDSARLSLLLQISFLRSSSHIIKAETGPNQKYDQWTYYMYAYLPLIRRRTGRR